MHSMVELLVLVSLVCSNQVLAIASAELYVLVSLQIYPNVF